MSWIRPNDVHSPREHWEMISVLYDGGTGLPAVAFGRWDGDEIIAIRWNGTDDPGKTLGNPQSRTYPTWFVLPTALALATLRLLLEKQAVGDPAVQSQGLAQAISHYEQAGHIGRGL
jgi:hypothetical protein